MAVLYFRYEDDPDEEIEFHLEDHYYHVGKNGKNLILVREDVVDVGDVEMGVEYEVIDFTGCISIRFEIEDHPFFAPCEG